MRKIISIMMITGMLASNALSAKSAEQGAAPKVRVALYVDNGSRGNGVLQWASFVAFSPQAEFSTVDGEDVRNNKLDNVDVIIMPGGASWWQCPSLGEKGKERLREFLMKGGGYIGTCAGMACAMNDKERIGLLPYNSNKQLRGGVGIVSVEISPEGAGILGIAPGLRAFRYAGGPIAYPCDKPIEDSSATVLATFKSMVTRSGKNAGGFDYPAMILGRYGKGKVMVSSIHPESWEATHDMVSAMFYAVCGVKIAPEMPGKNPRPWRVGILTAAIIGHKTVKAALDLARHPDLDVKYIMQQDTIEGALNHLDYLVIPSGVDFLYKKYFAMEVYRNAFRRFTERGGIILAAGNGSSYLAPHSNVKKVADETLFIKEILQK